MQTVPNDESGFPAKTSSEFNNNLSLWLAIMSSIYCNNLKIKNTSERVLFDNSTKHFMIKQVPAHIYKAYIIATKNNLCIKVFIIFFIIIYCYSCVQMPPSLHKLSAFP